MRRIKYRKIYPDFSEFVVNLYFQSKLYLMNKKYSILILTAMCLMIAAASCSSDDDSTGSSFVVSDSYTSTLVSNFTLGNNDKVLYNLDSVFFSIDQDKNLIYNADSLPKGTDVSHLTVSVTFPNAVGKAVFKVSESEWMEDKKEVEYSSETTDSIDFTHPVELQITSQDGKVVRTYEVRVNVHQMQADSLYWDQKARRDLPNTSGDPKNAKCVEQNGNYFCLVTDTYGYVLSKASNPGQGSWERLSVAFSFEPDVASFVASTDAFYILSTEGELYKSTDQGQSWIDCGVQWHSIKGAYGQKVLGVMSEGGEWKHDEYPRGSFTPVAIDPLFPIDNSTDLVMASNTWTVAQQAMLMGGRNQAGEVLRTVWGYDGQKWGRIDNEYAPAVLPELEGAVLVSYASFMNDTITHRLSQRSTWIVMGGRKADGTMNGTTYVSYNQGITWSSGGIRMQLPEYMPPFVGAQAFVVNETQHKVRANAPIRPITQWDCPYIYLVGGKTADGRQLNNIWKGVINQLTFKPIH